MNKQTLFEYIKDNVKISDFVRTLEQTKGLHLVGQGEYRCNNVIARGEGTTSMRIRDDEGFFKMFSHGQESGDVITLYQYTLGAGESPYQAALSLANYMGIAIPEELKSQKYSSKQDLYVAMNLVGDRIQEYLLESPNEDAHIARRYLEDRGVSLDILQEWGIGLFPSNYQECISLVSKGIQRDVLIKANILDKQGKYVPMMGRLAFPIFAKNGDILAFSSRKIDGVHCLNSDAKYINTSSTEIYDKSKVLYGQHLIGKGADKVVICEGNLDVIALNEMVDADTVALATCGTALTESHIPLLKSIGASKYTILFDADAAGKKSSTNLVWLSNHLPFVSISEVSGGKDPWDGYVAGVDILAKVQFEEPIVWSAPDIAWSIHDNKGFLQWFRKTFEQLVYLADRNALMDASLRASGMRRVALENAVSGVKQQQPRAVDTQDVSLSDGVRLLIAALLSIQDMNERRFFAFPLCRSKYHDQVCELLGSQSDTEDDAIAVALGDNTRRSDSIVHAVYSLTRNDEDEELDAMEDFCRFFAKRIASSWQSRGVPSAAIPYISAVSMIASGASPAPAQDKMLLLFDVSTI